ncbi:MAG: lipid-binding SYLF domain-containing protein [Candidatus Omnitrophota bacterium]|nr:lipid-binding SYLF domain-containing protein [Candidatus Omnitrophota bacterium]
MKRFEILFSVIYLISIIFCCPNASADNKWTALVEECGTVLSEIQQMPDENIPSGLMKKCSAIAIFPSTISAGLGIGGKYGQGIIMVRNEKSGKWSSPAIFTLVGASIGFQIGGEATDIVLLIMTRRSVEAILEGKFKLGVDASVAAGPVGRNAAASTDAHLGGILSYSRSRGLFAGIKLEGDVINQHWEGNKALYGKDLSAEEILVKNKAKMPKSAKDLLETLKK